MKGIIRRAVDNFYGRGESSVTVPVMDGPFMPNEELESAQVVLDQPDIDNLVASNGSMFASSGPDLLRLGTRGTRLTVERIERYDCTITSLAAGPEGALAIGLDESGIIVRGGPFDGGTFGGKGVGCLRSPVAMIFDGSHQIIVANGSAHLPASQWRRDLMNLGRSGSVWRFDLLTCKGTSLVDGLGFPYGLTRDNRNRLCISDSWNHRIIALDPNGGSNPDILIDHLPGYPARFAVAANGGFWLSVFAPRNQLIEFILREPRYRRRMLTEVPEDDWMAPALASGLSINEPLQWSAIMQMGIMKPWAAGRSYGLLVFLDAELAPRWSCHSRANGSVHGVTSTCEFDGSLFACAKGSGKIIRLPLDSMGQ
jgi:hypothetical protein